MTYQTYILPNGLRMIHAPSSSHVSYLGFAVNAGSRDEKEEEYGMAHFVEHTIFKGTKKRKAWHILNRMENVGGELNAYTSKEETLVYSVFLEQHLERAFDLLSDLTFRSQFPAHEIEKEKEVILDEILSYEDSPSEIIFDEFENLLFKDHPLGHNILGSPETLMHFTREKTTGFFRRYYFPENMVLFHMGKTDIKKLVRLAEKYLSDTNAGFTPAHDAESVLHKQATNSRKKKETYQAHVILGNYAYSYYDPERMGLVLLNNMLGGPGMNSRLNLSLRERSGLVYNVESSYSAFKDTGIFTIYFGTEQKNLERCMQLVKKELNAFCTKKISPIQLNKAKAQLMGQISIGREQRENVALSMGKSFLRFNTYEELPDMYKKIEKITAEDLLEIANAIFNTQCLSSLIYE